MNIKNNRNSKNKKILSAVEKANLLTKKIRSYIIKNIKEEKFKKQQIVTEKIKEAKFGANATEPAEPSNIKSISPEIDYLYKIRKTITEKINNKEKPEKIKNLYPLLSSINLMLISHKKLSKNDGSTTEGSEQESVEEYSIFKMKKLQKEINEKTFKWKNIKRIDIKRKNKKPRPIGIPNFSEKIIQNIILMILEAIYEPIFEETNKSFGFRPHKSTKDSIKEITKYENQGLQWAIEGDIEGAFNNVNPNKLARLLNERIDDKEFVNIIYQSCITSTIDKHFNIKSSLIGTPQGSIISPILFNIYMHEFDIKTEKILNQMILDRITKGTIKRPTNPLYQRQTYDIGKTSKIINQYENTKKLRNLRKEEKTDLYNQKIKKQIKIIRRSKTERIDYSRTTIRYHYNRYADDFLILTNTDQETSNIIKEKISEYLKTELNLTLSLQKTKITKLTEKPVNYLGYSLFMSNKMTARRTTTKKVQLKPGKQILIGIDLNRLYTKYAEQYADPKTLKPKALKAIQILTQNQIIDKYNSIQRGLYNYYYDIITYKSQLDRIHYILYYSALKTLAGKHKTNTLKIYQMYGWTEKYTSGIKTNKTRIIYNYKIFKKNQTIEKYAILFNHQDLKKYMEAIIKNKPGKLDLETQTLNDIWTKQKHNWRTTFKLTQYCNICGSTEDLETHHIRKISGPTVNPEKTFTQNIMTNLNRKQLVVCRKCHNRIHSGKYNNLKLSQIYDVRTIRIENYLNTVNPKNKIEKINEIEIYDFDPINRIITNHLIS